MCFRETEITKVLKSNNNGNIFLELEEFKVRISENNDGYCELRIIYLPEPKFRFEFKIDKQSITGMESIKIKKNGFLKVTPGEYLETEFLEISLVNYLSTLKEWRERIENDIEELSTIRIIRENQKKINQILGRFTNLKDEYYSEEERITIKEKLEDLQRSISERIKQQEDDGRNFEDKLNQLINEIEELKKEVDILKKDGVLRRVFSTLYKYSKEIGIPLLEAFTKFLPPSSPSP